MWHPRDSYMAHDHFVRSCHPTTCALRSYTHCELLLCAYIGMSIYIHLTSTLSPLMIQSTIHRDSFYPTIGETSTLLHWHHKGRTPSGKLLTIDRVEDVQWPRLWWGFPSSFPDITEREPCENTGCCFLRCVTVVQLDTFLSMVIHMAMILLEIMPRRKHPNKMSTIPSHETTEVWSSKVNVTSNITHLGRNSCPNETTMYKRYFSTLIHYLWKLNLGKKSSLAKPVSAGTRSLREHHFER